MAFITNLELAMFYSFLGDIANVCDLKEMGEGVQRGHMDDLRDHATSPGLSTVRMRSKSEV
jgi:hypothetical protein